MSIATPTSTSSTSSPLLGNKLISPTLSRRNNGVVEDDTITPGVVEKLVNEFQQQNLQDTPIVFRNDTSATSPSYSRKHNNADVSLKQVIFLFFSQIKERKITR